MIEALDESAKQQKHDQNTITANPNTDDPEIAAAKQRVQARDQGYAVSIGTDENGRRVTIYTNPQTGQTFSVPTENDPDQAADDALSLLKGPGPHTDPDITDQQARAALRGHGLIVETRINPVTGRPETIITDPTTGAIRYITTTPDGTTTITDIAGTGTARDGAEDIWSKFTWGDSNTGSVASSAPMDVLSDMQKHMLKGQSMSLGEKIVLRYGLRAFGPVVGGIIGAYTDWNSGEMSLGKAIGTNAAGALAGSAGGALLGAAAASGAGAMMGAMGAGAAAGSVVPVVGTAVGLILGAVIGFGVTKALQ